MCEYIEIELTKKMCITKNNKVVKYVRECIVFFNKYIYIEEKIKCSIETFEVSSFCGKLVTVMDKM